MEHIGCLTHAAGETVDQGLAHLQIDGRPKPDLPLPTWQRSHRVHGYWLDGQCMGHIRLSPRGMSSIMYAWAIDASANAWGEERTLRSAKRRVEAAFRQLYSWRFPALRASRGY